MFLLWSPENKQSKRRGACRQTGRATVNRQRKWQQEQQKQPTGKTLSTHSPLDRERQGTSVHDENETMVEPKIFFGFCLPATPFLLSGHFTSYDVHSTNGQSIFDLD